MRDRRTLLLRLAVSVLLPLSWVVGFGPSIQSFRDASDKERFRQQIREQLVKERLDQEREAREAVSLDAEYQTLLTRHSEKRTDGYIKAGGTAGRHAVSFHRHRE